ncbi:MAG: hypothetical protein JJU18_04495 [Oceanicaulis sp.]|nr:hypothetical protein [Oceanicaulis sp.]
MNELYRFLQQRESRKRLSKLFDISDTVLVIHYSCESFFKRNDGFSPKIASISIRNLSNGTSTSFSIHHYAEREGVDLAIKSDEYEYLEYKLLFDYFNFVRNHLGFTWAHWNMRNINYGFQALEHRFRVLRGEPVLVPDTRKIDLADLMQRIYGPEYAQKPVLVNVCKMNNIESEFFLAGSEEAKAFDAHEYMKLHQSTLKKVDFISYIAEYALQNKLKTKANFFNRYGLHPRVLIEIVKQHWIVSALAMIAMILGILRFVS